MKRILSKLSISQKLGGSFVIIVLILAVSLFISYSDMSQLNRGMMSLYFDHTIPIQDLGETKALLGQIKSNIQLYIQIPKPKSALTGSQDAPRCGTCHISEVSGSHNLQTGQTVGDATRCLACHSKQAGDSQHGRSAANIAAGHAAELDCAACHSADVINQQHSLVEKSITDEIARVNEIISAYGKNPLLTAEEKTALAGFETSWNSYQNIVADLLAKFKSGLSQETLHRVVAGDAFASQKEIEEALNSLVTVNQKLASQSQENSAQTFKDSTLRLLIAGIAGIILATGLSFGITNDIRTPIEALARGLQNMRQGNLNWDVPSQVKENIIQRSDEIGVAGQGFDSAVQYLQEMAGIASQVASGNLTVKVTARGGQDELGIAFSRMIASLQNLINLVTENANNLTSASGQLASAYGQSGEATRQIAITIQQVALGTAQQTASVTKTSGAVEQMGRAIDGVAKGAQEQARAISMASQISARINAAIKQVANNVQTVALDSAQSASYSRDGAETVKETILGMETIRSKVGVSAAKVEEMGVRSEEIGDIVKTIDDIASLTNLLALNAAIEAAHVESSGNQANEKLAQAHLVSVSKLLAEMLCINAAAVTSEYLADLSRQLNIEVLSVTDDDGVVVINSQPASHGFRFADNGEGQSAAFRPLLAQKNGVVVQPIMPQDLDNQLYLFVGVSRRDQFGIIQAGMSAEKLSRLGNNSRGFAVVADEVRKLAGRSGLAAKEIAALIKGIQKTVSEAVTAMQASAAEVEAGVTRANSAGQVLEKILGAAESVNKQAEEAGQAAAKVRSAAAELVEAVDSVSAVIEENTAATEEMAANSNELTQAIENIASVSEENSASVEEVSASTEEVSAQVEEVSASAKSLTEMAQKLQQVISQFKLK